LKAFLNNIFGIQANVYFTDVVRSDNVVDYDVIEPRDKQLNMSGNRTLTTEEAVLADNVRDASADINIYFVNSFLYGGPDTIGKAVSSLGIAYIKNSTNDLREVAAHEIGHCLGITYHANEFPDFNPAYLKGKDATKRLMRSQIQANPKNVLIKAEWDLINKND
jgi:Metallo-peptidase family M12B Reprolysin-like